MRTERCAPLARAASFLLGSCDLFKILLGIAYNRDAGGSRTHLDRVAAGCRAVWLQRRIPSVLARDRTGHRAQHGPSTFAESRAIRHTPRTNAESCEQDRAFGAPCLRRRLPAHYLRRRYSVLLPHTGWRLSAVRCHRSPTGPQAGTCPTSTWSCSAADR